MSAAETPGAIAAIVAWPCGDCAMPANVLITPQTVPSNPRNGAPLTAMASKIKPDSSLSDSRATAPSSVRLICSMALSVMKDLSGVERDERFVWYAGIGFEPRVQLRATLLI